MDFSADSDFGSTDDDLQDAGAGQLAWRETYFIFFRADSRPTLTQVEAAIGNAGRRLQLEHLKADDDGLFRSVLVQAAEDNAALDIRFDSGDEVIEQAVGFAEQLRDELDEEQLPQLLDADGRLEVMHFERLTDAASGMDDLGDPDAEPFAEEGLDPATLISVVEALATLTEGLPIDPASGAVVI